MNQLEIIQKSAMSYIIGADECGCGSIAGPFTVCAVRAPKNWNLKGLGDSKKLSQKQREIMEEKLFEIIDQKEITYSIVDISNQIIDQDGFGICFKRAHKQAIELLNNSAGPNLIILDGNRNLDLELNGSEFTSLPKADSLIPAVMAASILAKTHRDAIMRELHKEFPVYGWDSGVGYGTKAHYAAMKEHGITKYHRTSFKTVLDYQK